MNRSDLSTINFNDIYVDYDWAAKQPERYETAINIFEDNFGTAGDFEIYSAPGRTEIGGNHTDHQHGEVLAASINRDAIAIVKKDAWCLANDEQKKGAIKKLLNFLNYKIF